MGKSLPFSEPQFLHLSGRNLFSPTHRVAVRLKGSRKSSLSIHGSRRTPEVLHPSRHQAGALSTGTAPSWGGAGWDLVNSRHGGRRDRVNLAHRPIRAGESHSIQMALCMQSLLRSPGAEGCLQPGLTQCRPPGEGPQREVGAQPQISRLKRKRQQKGHRAQHISLTLFPS